MTNIVEFLTARLDEDAQVATEAKNDHKTGEWKQVTNRFGEHRVEDELGYEVVEDTNVESGPWYATVHIARQDPARVLREVAAKRAIIEQWRLASDGVRRDDCDEAAGAAWAALSIVLVSLAGAYQTHPDYKGHDMDDWEWPDGESLRS